MLALESCFVYQKLKFLTKSPIKNYALTQATAPNLGQDEVSMPVSSLAALDSASRSIQIQNHAKHMTQLRHATQVSAQTKSQAYSATSTLASLKAAAADKATEAHAATVHQAQSASSTVSARGQSVGKVVDTMA